MEKQKRLLMLDLGMSLVLFGVSAILTLLLFYESAGERLIYKAIFSVLALCFDATKVLLWIRGIRERNWTFKCIALSLAIVSLFSASGSAFMITAKDSQALTQTQASLHDLQATYESRQKEVDAWQRRLDAVPSEYTTQLALVSKSLAAASEGRDSARDALQRATQESASVASSSATMFSLLGGAFGVDASSLKLVFLLVVAILLETSAFATSYHSRPKDAPSSRYVLLADATGIAHFLKAGKALCGKPIVESSVNRQSPGCRICMERSVKDAQA